MRIHAHQDVYMQIIRMHRMDLQPHRHPKNTANEISSPRFLHRIWVLSWCSSKKTSWCKFWSHWGKLIWQHFMISMWMHTMCSSASKFAPAWWFPRTCFLLRTQIRWRNRGISCAAAWWGIEDTDWDCVVDTEEAPVVLVGEDTLPTCNCHLEALFPHHLSTADDDTVLPVDEDTVLTSSSLPLYSSLPSLPSFYLSSLPIFLFICLLLTYLPSWHLLSFSFFLHLYSISLPPFPFFLSSLSFSFYVHHFSVSFFFVSLFFVSSFSFGEHLLLFIY